MSAKISIIDGQVFVILDGTTLPAAEAILALRNHRDDARSELSETEAKLADAEKSYADDLAADGDPTKGVIGRCKGDVTKAKKSVVAIESDLARIHAEIVDHEAGKMFSTAIAGIKSDTGIESDLNESVAQNVAEVGLRLAVAQIEHGEALQAAESVRNRVADIERKMQEITQRRIDGNQTDSDAQQITALDYDKAALQDILSQAVRNASSLDPAEIRDQHQRALSVWNNHVRDSAMKALADAARDREADLVAALSNLAGAAHEAGIQNITEIWRPSEELQTFVGRTLVSAMLPRAA